jgi:signal peptidase I
MTARKSNHVLKAQKKEAPSKGSSKNKPDEIVEETEDEKESDGLLNAILFAAIIAIVVRSFLFEPFSIPSGSMFPTLKVGDYLFVSKYSYGYSKYSFPLGVIDFDGRIFEKSPERGDIVVFRKPYQEHIDYIKRVIGLPGDEIQMIDGQLHINGKLVPRDFIGMETISEDGVKQTYFKYIQNPPDTDIYHNIYELSDEEALDFTTRFKIPEGYFFAMGDNRDESLDSRAVASVGFVPMENLVGRASFFFFSVEPSAHKCQSEGSLALMKNMFCKIFYLPTNIRYERIFRPVNRSVK